MDRDDLELFTRSLRHATEQHTGAELDGALAELGWSEAHDADPEAAVSVLFELQGSSCASSAAIEQVLRSALGLSAEGSVLLPALSGWSTPGRLDGDRLTVAALGTAAVTSAGSLVVVARSADGHMAVTVPTEALVVRPIEGLDPWLGLVEVTGEVSGVDAGAGEPVSSWDDAVAAAQVALGYELVGASRRMLELAREHALERVQFGQPISRFQAIRHKLADTLVAIETADGLLAASWLDRSPVTAAMAKSLAGRGARLTAKHCQQVLAGIGFTTEHDLHRYVRRVLVLDELFGSARALTKDLGEQLLATRQLPPLLPL